VGSKETVVIAVALLNIAIDGIFDHGGIGQRGCRQGLPQVDPLALTGAPGAAQR
jgi:hypothetical protein